jgi:NADPH-dependent ferric siderophore reductase
MTNPVPGPTTEAARPPRRRRPPRPVEVVSVAPLTPRLVSIQLRGEALAGFAPEAPTAHIKVFVPADGHPLVLQAPDADGNVWPEDQPRPIMRTYTPRRFDPATNTLEVQFALHGTGPAADWAARARVGEQIAIAGPGGRFQLDAGARRWWIGGDESAVPAVATLLEALPAGVSAEVHLEVADADDELPLPGGDGVTVHWHHRARPDAFGAELYDAVAGAELAGADQAWVACEAAAVRRIRKHLLAERGVAPSALTTRGYWRLGEANHPDHDYGDD